MSRTPAVDILIPTYNRPIALAVTMSSLLAQTYKNWRLWISDQSDEFDVANIGEIRSIAQVMESHGNLVHILKNLPQRGMAQQRSFLLEHADASYVLSLDDDLFLEPWVIQNLVKVIQEDGCGFTGSSVIGLHYKDDVRPHEQEIEFWEGKVVPEKVEVGSKAWKRHVLNNAANLYHIQKRLGLTPEKPRKYKVAWVAVCVLYDREKLNQVGGFKFWEKLPKDAVGEDVAVQLQVMAKFGGCGLLPSGVYHLNLPTTLPNREVDAPKVLDLFGDASQAIEQPSLAEVEEAMERQR